MWEGWEIYANIKRLFERLCVVVTIILKWILKKWYKDPDKDWPSTGSGPVQYCRCSDEHLACKNVSFLLQKMILYVVC